MKETKIKSIGCHKCRQKEDISDHVLQRKYDTGWLGEVELRLDFENWTEAMDSNYEYHDNDRAALYLTLGRNDTYYTEFLTESLEINFCPFCGADLKKVRDYMRSREREEE